MPDIYKDILDPKVVALINGGVVGVIPTDTLYGLIAKASNQKAVSELYRAKERNAKPGTIIAASIEQLVELGIKRRYLKAVEHLWPNPISIVLPVGSALGYIHQGMQTLAVRLPNQSKLIELLKQTGPLVTSSANKPGRSPAQNIGQAQSYFGDKIGFYVDGGSLAGAEPSTIMRVVDDAIEILRQGAVTIDETGRITK